MSTQHDALTSGRSSRGRSIRGWSRRRFLWHTGLAAASVAGPGPWARCLRQAVANPPPPEIPRRSRVVEVLAKHVVRSEAVHSGLLREMLAAGLHALTGQAREKQAWRNLLKPDDIIGLKFNRVGAAELGTTPAMAEVLVRSLADAGWSAEQLVPIELPPKLLATLGTGRPREDWLETEVEVQGRRDRLAGVLGQVTAIINVPFLKTHNIAGVTCGLKNLSHALVRHPAQFHEHGCAPFIGAIVALPPIRDKLRLSIANTLRVVIDKGPEARPECVVDRGGLLLARDPVAMDAVGVDIINHLRRDAGLKSIQKRLGAEVAYLPAAAKLGLGECDPHRIDYVRHRF